LAEENKLVKYRSFQPTYEFTPICFEVLGGHGSQTETLLNKLAKLQEEATNDKRAGPFMRQ